MSCKNSLNTGVRPSIVYKNFMSQSTPIHTILGPSVHHNTEVCQSGHQELESLSKCFTSREQMPLAEHLRRLQPLNVWRMHTTALPKDMRIQGLPDPVENESHGRNFKTNLIHFGLYSTWCSASKILDTVSELRCSCRVFVLQCFHLTTFKDFPLDDIPACSLGEWSLQPWLRNSNPSTVGLHGLLLGAEACAGFSQALILNVGSIWIHLGFWLTSWSTNPKASEAIATSSTALVMEPRKDHHDHLEGTDFPQSQTRSGLFGLRWFPEYDQAHRVLRLKHWKYWKGGIVA